MTEPGYNDLNNDAFQPALTGKSWISDGAFFGLVLGITVAVLSVVVGLKLIPDEYRPNLYFARHLPFVNAVINSCVAVTVLTGYYFIRVKRNKGLHQFFMLTAFVLSAIFLVCYVIKGMVLPETKYPDDGGAMRYLYFFILLTHIVLAAVILPMVLYTIWFSTSGKLRQHKRLARITFPLWMYVAISGVLVYVLISPYYNF